MQFYTRLMKEVKERMDRGEDKLECFAARLWEQYDKLGLDVESLAYGTLPIHHHLSWFCTANSRIKSLVPHSRLVPEPRPA